MENIQAPQSENPLGSLSQPPPIPEQPKKSWVRILLIGVFGIVVLSSAIFAGYQFKSSKTAPSPTPTPSPAITSVKEGDPTANWKTYNDAEYDFSFKHPQDASIDSVVKDALGHFVSVKSSTLDLTVSIDSLGYDPGDVGADKVWKVDVNGITWNGRYDKANKCSSPCPSATQMTSHVKNHRIGYLFRDEISDEMIKKFLSTFKFVEQNQAISPGSESDTARPGEPCGGIIGKPYCIEGYNCSPDPRITGFVGDAPGICIKD